MSKVGKEPVESDRDAMVGDEPVSIPFSERSDEWKKDAAVIAEYLAGYLESDNPAAVAETVRTIMRARGEETAGVPTIGDLMAITKMLGITIRADKGAWGIGPHLSVEEFEKPTSDPRFTIPTLEHEGYIAILEVDVNASLIRGRFVNAYSFPDFFGQTVDGAKAAFREVIRREKERADSSGYQPEQPHMKNLPCFFPKQFDEWFPELTRTRGKFAIVFRTMDRLIAEMRKRGFLDEQSTQESRSLTIKDYQNGLFFISSFIGNYAPMPTKIGWIIWRLSEELSLIATGGHPQFLRPAVYSGTKTGSPKHSTLRLQCALTVASLMRRGVSRDDACRAIANLLNEMRLSTKKNRSPVSARTVTLPL